MTIFRSVEVGGKSYVLENEVVTEIERLRVRVALYEGRFGDPNSWSNSEEETERASKERLRSTSGDVS